MQLQVNEIVVSNEPNDEVIIRELKNFSGEGDCFAILSATEMTYIQVGENFIGGLDLEYQDGSVDEHYICLNKSFDAEAVIRIFILFLHSDIRWKIELQWEKSDPDDWGAE